MEKEKIIIGFLVAAGLFSLVQAGQYVQKLTNAQKAELILVADDNGRDTTVEPPRLVKEIRLG